MIRFQILWLAALLLWVGVNPAVAQSRYRADCLDAFRVRLPIDHMAYNHLPKDGAPEFPVLNYLVEDQYTFWYRLDVSVADTLEFTVIPTNESDLFQAAVYAYTGEQFCKDMVLGIIRPHDALSDAVFVGGIHGEFQSYRYKIPVAAGQSYYLSVMSLTDDYCGHRLSLRYYGEELHFHAMNKPCYDFNALDFTTEEVAPMEPASDPLLELDLPETASALPPVAESTVLEPVIQKTPEPHQEDSSPLDVTATVEEPVAEENDVVAGLTGAVGDKVELEEVYFYNNTYAFRRDSEAQLDQLYRLMEQQPGLEIEIRGHTAGNTANIKPNPLFKDRGKAWSFKGSSKKLSQKRAEAVKDYLIEKGISGRRIKTKGMGDAEKIVKNPKTPADHRRNMRVEIAIIAAENK